MSALRLLPFLVIPLLLSPAARGGEDEEVQRDAAVAIAVRKVKAVRDAERVVVAVVKEVHESPGVWCGYVVTRQEVTYQVVESVSGGPVSGDVRVGHLLVAGSPLISKDAPFVRPSVIYPGARFLLCLNRSDETWVLEDESFGALAIDPPRQPDPMGTELLRLLLERSELQAYLHPEVQGRVPLTVVLTEAVPVAPDLECFGRRVAFVPAYLLRGDPHLAITAIDVGDERAEVRFTYDVEGVTGRALFVRDGEHYRLEALNLVER